MKFIDSRVIFSKLPSLLFIIFLLSCGLSVAVNAQSDPAKPQSAREEITKETLQAKIDAINTRQGLDELSKAKLLKFYQSAQDNLGNLETFKARAADFKLSIKQAPDTTKKLQKEIEQAQAKPAKQKFEDFSHIATEELDQRLIIEKEKISSLNDQFKKLENELALQQARPQLIRQETVSAQQELEATQKKLETPPPASESKLETEAERAYLKTLLEARGAELKMLEIEAISHTSRVELLKAQFQLLDMQKNARGPTVGAIENTLTERRQQEAQKAQNALSQAEKELSGKHAVIQEITRQNIQFSRDLQTISTKIDGYNEQKTKLDALAREIDGDFKSAEKKISLAGLSPALGKILREQRRNLLSQSQLSLQSETIQNETAIASLEQFKVEDNLKKLADIDSRLQEVMALKVEPQLPAEQRMMIQAELRVLMNNQKDLLNKLSAADTTYLRTLGDFDFARQQMAAQAEKFAAFLDERLLWVPSSEPVNSDYPAELYHSTQWLLSPLNWLNITADTVNALLNKPFLTMAAILSLIALLTGRRWRKLQLAMISEKVSKIYTDRFYYTLKALTHTFFLVLPLPLLIYYWGWFLTHNMHAFEFSKALGAGLQTAAIPLFFIQFFYRLFAPTGIARKHFQWSKDTTGLLRKQIAWLRFVAVPTVFLIHATGASKIATHSDSMGRLALIISMLAMAVFFRNILNPGKGLLQHHIQSYPNGWLNKSRYIWYPAALLLPAVIIGFAVAGYYLSALELQQKLIITLRLIFLIIIAHEMVLRWLTLVNRQLALENARQKRRSAAEHEKQHAAVGGEDPVLPVDEQLIDIPKLNAQTLKLLHVFIGLSVIIGFWVIWKNILPAFSFLDRIELWEHVVTIDKQETLQPITLTNLLVAGLYIFITMVSVLNFSGLMEILLFRRLAIETGSRYAVNQLAKYAMVSIGFISVANELGGSWTQVQWLVAALSVGLGFGLQEIFANLVSGIILLFERPIRIGDTVTIGDITGKVSRIQMRATTIIDWDQKELIVPNKTFITNQLVNWTLSDAITRVVIPVGIAYGSDVALAHKVMLETVQNTPLVLADPEPCVLLLAFGDSTLNFSIRVFVSEMSHRLQVINDLHFRLEHALREHHIEIPLPQREVHVRNVSQDSHNKINTSLLQKTILS